MEKRIMELIQFDLTGRGQADIAETVYDSLHGFLIPACSLPWVDMVFQPGHPAHDSYEQMLQIKDRIAARLDGDCELEALVDCALAYSKSVALEMFRCGQQYQKILNEK